MEHHNQRQLRRLSVVRAEKNDQWQKAMTEMIDNALVGGFVAFLASSISVVAGVENENFHHQGRRGRGCLSGTCDL
eukprot:scaffold133488_cov39-Cyclotella_meneghiniana.AAC.7